MKELSRIVKNLPQSGIRKLQEAAREIPDAIRLETGNLISKHLIISVKRLPGQWTRDLLSIRLYREFSH